MSDTENKEQEVAQEVNDQEVEATAEVKEEVVEEKDELTKLQEEKNAMNDKYLRLMADFENFKRQSIKERMETTKLANKDIMLSLVEVLDDFDRGAKTIEEATDIDSVKEGLNLIHTKLKSTLESKGLKSMDAKGEVFNADVHEAVCNIPAPSEEDKGKVVDVIEKGYTLKDSIIRFAKVVVGE